MRVLFSILILLMGSMASANNSAVAYQGRIFKPDGNPLEGSSVQFRMQVRSPGTENCLLYEELQTLNMSGSLGIFSITMNDSSGTRLDPATYPLDRIFANRDTMTLDSTRCATGTTYTPSSGDGRKFIVYFKDETMSAYEPLPIMSINYAPQALYALESQKVDKFAVTNILRTVDASGNPVTAPALTPTQLTNFNNLIAGTSTQYASATPPYSSISAATATNTIDNTNFAQTWNWSTATTQSPMSLSANAITTGSVMSVSTSSAALNSTNGLMSVANTGASTNGILARFQSNSTAGSGLTVLANGNVGIGTTNPVSQLHVSAGTPAIRIEGTNAGQPSTLRFDGLDGGSVYRGSWISFNPVAGTNQSYFAFSNGSTDLLNVRMDGNVGIGTTSPAAKLDVADTGTTTSAIIVPRAGAFTGTTVNGMLRYNSTSNLFEFYQNGAWVNYTTVSDARLKTNVVPVSSTQGLDIVNQLNPVFYDWDKNNPRTQSFGDKHQVGFIAQEVEKVLPEVVDVGEDSYRSVQYGKIVSVVVAAVKELYNKFLGHDEQLATQARQIASKADKTETDALKAKSDKLEVENAKLKQENAAIKAYLCGKDPKAAICK